jgi:hypothetical protein
MRIWVWKREDEMMVLHFLRGGDFAEVERRL